MTLLIQLTIAGTDTGPFNLYSDVDDFTSAFEVNISKASLMAGYTSYLVPDGTNSIRVMSGGVCTNYIDIPVSTTTTTTTIDPCSCITFTNSTAFDINVFWTPCSGFLAAGVVPALGTLNVCGNNPTCDTPGLSCSIGDPCLYIGEVYNCTSDCCDYTVNPPPSIIDVTVYPVDCNGNYLPDVTISSSDPAYTWCGLKGASSAYIGSENYPIVENNCPCTTTTTTTLGPCLNADFYNNSLVDVGTLSYTDCYGVPQTILILPSTYTGPLCYVDGTVVGDVDVEIIPIGPC
jgi:hypothetical protein